MTGDIIVDTIVRELPVQGGTIVITGAKGVGKTFLAATYAPPGMESRVFWHDSERSANNVTRKLERLGRSFGYYRNLGSRFDSLPDEADLLTRINREDLPWVNSRQRNALADYYLFTIRDLCENMGKDQYDVYVHDTIETLESGMVAYVSANKGPTGWSRDSHGRMWSEAVYPLYDHLVESLFIRGVKTVILCSHLKTPWENNQPIPNSVKPAGKKILYKLSTLMLWLVKGKKAPSAIVLKERLGDLSIGSDGDWDVECKLPERIPVCTWREIDRYLKEGCDLDNPAPGERMTPDEERMISDLLTDRQMDLMISTAKKQAQGASSQPEVPAKVQEETDMAKTKALGMREAGLTDDEIRVQLQALEYPIPTVLRVMKEIGG